MTSGQITDSQGLSEYREKLNFRRSVFLVASAFPWLWPGGCPNLAAAVSKCHRKDAAVEERVLCVGVRTADSFRLAGRRSW